MDSKDKNKNIYDQAMEARKADLNEHSDKVREIEKENAERAENMKAHSSDDPQPDFDLEEIKADLGLFELKDYGSDYLKVYHPAIDVGAELGIISKEEYGKLTNKEAFFKSTLENAQTPEITQRHTLAFDGEFVEPTVATESIKEIITSKDYEAEYQPKTGTPCHCRPGMERDNCPSCEGTGMQVDFKKIREENSTEAEQDTSLPQAKMTDEYEKSVQMETQKTESDYNILSTTILNNLYSQLKQDMKFDSVSILTAKYNADKTALNVYASLQDKIGEKFVSLDIPVEGLTSKPLSNSTIASIVSKTADLASKISEELKGEVNEKFKQIDADEEWRLSDIRDIIDSHDQVNTEDFIEEKFNDVGKQFCPMCDDYVDVMEDGACKNCWNPTLSDGELQETEASKKSNVKKIASSDSGGTIFSGEVDVLNVDKHSAGLPEDIAIGDIVYADGNYWKVMSKDKNNLSKEENSGSLITLHKVPAESVDEEPEHSIE